MSRTLKLTSSLATLALVGAGLGAVSSGTASAEDAAAPATQTLASGLLSPLSLAVGRDGTRYFSQNFAGILNRQKPGQAKPKVIYSNTDGFEVGAVSEKGGSLRFALSKNQRRGVIMGIGNSGEARPIANLGVFEKKNNPDADVAYGFRGLAADCAAQMPKEGPPPSYTGIVETHPYATLQVAGGTTYVADAAANAIFAIPRPGKVKVTAVLPPVPVTVTAEAAEAFQFPDCVVGKKYFFEAVPTDIEVGRGGSLFVSTLPGGPEDGSLGENARIYRINPKTGKVAVVGTGLLSATGLDVAGNGDIYVAELFRQGGRISRIPAGTSTPVPFVSVPLPADVEVTSRGIFATIKALPGENEPPAGELVRIRR